MKFKFGIHCKFHLFVLCLLSSSFGFSQNFEVSSDTYDSLAVDDYFIRLSGYATFTDSMMLHVDLISNDTNETVIYMGSHDFTTESGTLSNFVFDSSSEEFSLDIGNYSTHDFLLHIWSEISGELKEELFIHIDEL